MPEGIVYCGIGITEDEISEIQDGRKVVSIKKNDIRRIQFQKAIAEERPLLLTIFGIILMIPGFIASKVFLLWLSEEKRQMFGMVISGDTTRQ